MTFTSFNFWLIFPLIFVIYWLIPVAHNKIRNIFLLIVSYLLYLNWKPTFALALLGVTIICFGGGICLIFSVLIKEGQFV
jgi:D-alanyl-lipoteichoic acid acyltransferase DltB (MBOAT superfamily)